MGTFKAHDDHERLDDDGGVAARVWHFVQRQLRLRPRAASCPNEAEARGHAVMPTPARPRSQSMDVPNERVSCSAWSRVAMLREVEATHAGAKEGEEDRVEVCASQRRRVQRKCANCGQLFFRALREASAFCDRDCQSSFEYLQLVQGIVDGAELATAEGCDRHNVDDRRLDDQWAWGEQERPEPRGVAIVAAAKWQAAFC